MLIGIFAYRDSVSPVNLDVGFSDKTQRLWGKPNKDQNVWEGPTPGC